MVDRVGVVVGTPLPCEVGGVESTGGKMGEETCKEAEVEDVRGDAEEKDGGGICWMEAGGETVGSWDGWEGGGEGEGRRGGQRR